MHSSTAVLHSQPFSLGYPPSSSSSDCIGSQQQRYFSPSAAFNTGDEENNSRRIGPIGHSLSDPSAISTSTNGLSYSPRGSGVQDVQFAPSPGGLLISPTDGTPADSIVSNPTSLYAQQASPWSRGMPGFVSPGGRIPTLHPAVNQPNSLQGSGSSLSGNPIMARDTYPGGYALSRNAFPSPSATLNDYPRYPYSSSMPQAVGNQLDAYSSYIPTHRASQPVLDAPPFRDTENINHIMGSNNQKVTPVIQAKIHKGFFQADDKWTCYRRNYFSVSCSFTLQPLLNGGTYYFQTQGQRVEPIVNWAMSISAVVNESDNETRELVQHTPKRDKQSERKPEKVCLRPHQPYYLASNMAGSSPHSPMFGVTQQMDFPGYGVSAQPPQQHTFERIQFQKATANNGKRRAQQQFYNLVVELHALVSRQDGQHWEKVARRLSDPMVVRGRSPGHYKDERRHSSASMGDSGGRGSSGDTGRGMLPSSIDHQQYSSQMQYLYDSSQPGDSHYNHCRDMPRHSYSQFGQTNHSAEAISPLVSTSDGSLEFIFPDTLGGHQSTDVSSGLSHGSRYHHSHHHQEDDSSFRRDSGSSGSSSTQSHVPSLDLSSNSGTLDDTFDPMIAEYHSDEQDDGSEHYSKHANAERCPLASIVNDSSSQCSRNGSAGGTSFSRFIDPVQESLCA